MTNEPTNNEQIQEPEVETEVENTPIETIDANHLKTPKTSNLHLWIGVGVALATLVLGYVFLFTDINPSALIPFNKNTVALVNDVPIKQIEFQNSVKNVTDAYTQQGVDVTDPATIEMIEGEAVKRLINTELLLQAAAEAGYTAPDSRVDEQVNALTTEFGGEEALQTRLNELNIDKDMLRNDVREQIIVGDYLEKETAVGSITVTEEEIASFYENLKTQYGEQLPPLEDIRTQMEADIKIQKQQGVLSEILADLRANAEVEVRI